MKFRKVISSLVLLLAAVVVVFIVGGEFPIGLGLADAQQANDPDSLYREVINDSFGIGEKFTFSIGYGFITAGTATLEVRDTNTINNHLCYQIISLTNSNSFFDKFYKVRDTATSQIDVDGIYTHYFSKKLHEGSYDSEREIQFDYILQRAIYRKGSDHFDTLEISPFSQDVLSAFYYVRTIPELEPGESIVVNSVSGGKNALLEIKILKRETVEVAAGEFACVVVEPLLSSAGIFKHEGQIKVWLTDDRLHMPVLMKSKVLVGSIHAELESYRLGDLDW